MAVKSNLRRLFAYPFVTLYFLLSLVQFPIQLLIALCTRTAAQIQTGHTAAAFAPQWMLFVLTKLQIVYTVKSVRKPGPMIMAHIYCEKQGPSAGKEDHLLGAGELLPKLSECEEKGDPDNFGGRQLFCVGIGVICPRCGAPLRRFEFQS